MATYGPQMDFGDEMTQAQALSQDAQRAVYEKLARHGIDPNQQVLLDDPYVGSEELAVVRGEQWTGLVTSLTCPLLRVGFMLQALANICMVVCYYVYGGRGVFSYDLYNLTTDVRGNNNFALALMILEGFYLFGTILIASFQAFLVDNSKTSRGFRAASKLLAAAVTLDCVVIALRLMQYVYAYNYTVSKWWMKYNETKSDWTLFYFGSLLSGVSLIMYGFAIFYMEAYHDEGTYEEFGWALVVLYGLSGLLEIIMVLTRFGVFYSYINIVATIIATVWAFFFEPLIYQNSPEMHDRNVNQGIIPNKDDEEEMYEIGDNT